MNPFYSVVRATRLYLFLAFAFLLALPSLQALPFTAQELDALTPIQKEVLKNILQTTREHKEATPSAAILAAVLADHLEFTSEPDSLFTDQSINELAERLTALARGIELGGVKTQDSFVAHMKSLALQMNPDDLELAYELETFMLEKRVSLSWARDITTLQGNTMGERWVIDIGSTSSSVVSNSGGGLQKTQSHINGLLVRELDGSKFAGSASRMNATAIPASQKTSKLEVSYNQDVGESMKGALERTQTFLASRHEVPKGYEVEISFEEQYVPKDGPSAAIATTLLLESLISGLEIDPGFAVTGDMTATGEVGSVGGIDGKIRGAIRKNCNVVAIPSDNRNVISDLLALEGMSALSKIQIFEISTFSEAESLATAAEARNEDLQQAIRTFTEVQSVLNRSNGARFLKNPAVQTKLREVVKLAPHHLSARFLLLESIGRSPKYLSLEGSLQTIDRCAAPLLRALRDGKFGDESDAFNNDEFYETVSRLQRLRPKLDPRTLKCADSIVDYSRLWRVWKNDRPNTPGKQRELINEIIASQKQVGDRYDEIYSRDDVKEELGIEDEDE